MVKCGVNTTTSLFSTSFTIFGLMNLQITFTTWCNSQLLLMGFFRALIVVTSKKTFFLVGPISAPSQKKAEQIYLLRRTIVLKCRLTSCISPRETGSELAVFSKFCIWSLAQSYEKDYKWFCSFCLPLKQALEQSPEMDPC